MASRKMAMVLGLAVCLWGVPGVAADDNRVVAFNASVRVEVDAAGKPVKVEAPADLPEAIRGYIEKRVASWQYQPAKAHGAPAAAVTYVRVGACAIPVAEGYRLGLGDWRKQYQEELQARAIASKECIAASMPGGPLPIATDSPVTVTPVSAS